MEEPGDSIFFLQQVLNGLLAGMYYLLIALGLSLIFSLGGIVNLAHGAFYAIGAYLTVTLADYLGFGGSFVVSPVIGGMLGIWSNAPCFAASTRPIQFSP